MDDGASLWLSSMEQWNDGTNATCNDSKRIVPLAGKHDFKANLGGKWDFSRGMAVRVSPTATPTATIMTNPPTTYISHYFA